MIKNKFPFFKNNPKSVYLDSAATSLKLEEVIKTLNKFYSTNGTNVYRGSYKLSIEATNKFEETRKNLAKFINANPDEIIFTKGATQSLNLISYSKSRLIKKGDDLLTTELEHSSSFLPWLRDKEVIGYNINFVPLDKNNKITISNFKKSLTKKTKVVVITHISNVLGVITNIKEITRLAHEVGAIVILDCAQSFSRVKLDVKDIDCDFLVGSSHKAYGPFGLGFLYGKKELLKKLKPFEIGGDSINDYKKDNFLYKDIPHSFEAGTPPIAEVISFNEAIKFLNSYDITNIEKEEKMLAKYCYKELKKIKEIELYTDEPESGIISFNIKGIHPHDAATFYDEANIQLRAGKHCAYLLFNKLNLPTGSLRVSFGIYNTTKDIDKFIDVTKTIITFFGGKK